MSLRRVTIFIIIMLFSLCFAAAEVEKKAQTVWVPGVYHLGDPIELDINIPVKSSDFYVEGGFVEGSQWGDSRVGEIKKILPESFPGSLKMKVTLQVFQVGDVQLPPARISLRFEEGRELYIVSPSPVKITAMLPEGDQPKPAPETLLILPGTFPWLIVIITAAALVLLVVFIGVFLVRRSRKKVVKQVEIPLREADVHKWIRTEVERLFRADIPLAVRYEALSRRLREYLEMTMERPFLEWTTTEIVHACSDVDRLSGKPSERLLVVLRLCDSVLFARFVPEREDEERTKTETFRLLEEVLPRQEEKAS